MTLENSTLDTKPSGELTSAPYQVTAHLFPSNPSHCSCCCVNTRTALVLTLFTISASVLAQESHVDTLLQLPASSKLDLFDDGAVRLHFGPAVDPVIVRKVIFAAAKTK